MAGRVDVDAEAGEERRGLVAEEQGRNEIDRAMMIAMLQD